MYSKEQKDIALRIYHQTESATETIRILGYPSRTNLYIWIAEENTPPKQREEHPIIDNPHDHPRNHPIEVKLNAIHRCYELGENVNDIRNLLRYGSTKSGTTCPTRYWACNKTPRGEHPPPKGSGFS